MAIVIAGKTIIAGTASGLALTTDQPLSFWGGYDPRSGEIIDRRHPLAGKNARAKVLVLPSSRGSSTTTAILLEAMRAETAPAAIVTSTNDTFFALALIVSRELYGLSFPLLEVRAEDLASIKNGFQVSINEDGMITVLEPVP